MTDIISEFVQCPCCGEKDYLDADIQSCLQCGYDGSMENEWIFLTPPIPYYNDLIVSVSELAIESNTFSYNMNGSIDYKVSHTFTFHPSPIETANVIINHNYDNLPAYIAVKIDDGEYESFMINEHEFITLLPLTMSNIHFIYIILQSELPS